MKKDLGNPLNVERSSSGYEYWEYVYSKSAPTALFFVPGAVYVDSARSKMVSNVNHRLILKFDNKGVLDDYRTTAKNPD